jgi:predicted alpha/beta superfamily hydrolase
MTSLLFFLMLTIVLGMTSCQNGFGKNDPHIDLYPAFRSSYVAARQVEVLLPDHYDPTVKHDVIYVHDGQNVFDAHTSFTGIDWAVDERLSSMQKKGHLRPVIVVAIWNAGSNRVREYMPSQPREKVLAAARREGWGGEILSDAYLRFIVEELKPFIDSTYSTSRTPESTFIMGSSMGGLISLYAVLEYPEVFGGAACLSTHWPALGGVFLEYLSENIPTPGSHRFYFDFGTVGLDAQYEPYQRRVDQMMEEKGYVQGQDILTLKFQGADHSEAAWSKRIHKPLEFMLKKK